MDDIDGNGSYELIASLLNQVQSGDWRGQYFQVLSRSSGKWADVTESFFPAQDQNQSAGGIWCFDLHVIDLDLDGHRDLVCSSVDSYSSWGDAEAIWMWRDGRFVAWRDSVSFYAESEKLLVGIQSSYVSYLTPITLGGKKSIIGVNVGGSERDQTIKILGWDLVQ